MENVNVVYIRYIYIGCYYNLKYKIIHVNILNLTSVIKINGGRYIRYCENAELVRKPLGMFTKVELGFEEVVVHISIYNVKDRRFKAMHTLTSNSTFVECHP